VVRPTNELIKQNTNIKKQERIMKTTVKCPQCGAEFEIPEHEHVVMGKAIGEDSGLGTVYLKTKSTSTNQTNNTMSKAENRLASLLAMGIVSKEEIMDVPNNQDNILQDMGITLPKKDTPENTHEIAERIRKSGYSRDPRLARRWIMAQVLRGLNSNNGFTDFMKRKGIDYQWKMLINELVDQERMERHRDTECLEERQLFFNEQTIQTIMLEQYKEIKGYIHELPTRKYERKPYKEIPRHGYVYLDEISEECLAPMWNVTKKLTFGDSISKQRAVVEEFNRVRIRIPDTCQQSYTWQDSFKAAGAYFTMKNMLCYHGCTLEGLSGTKAVSRLLTIAREYMKEREGYCLMGMLKEFIKDNHFDYEQKCQEWYKAKVARRG